MSSDGRDLDFQWFVLGSVLGNLLIDNGVDAAKLRRACDAIIGDLEKLGSDQERLAAVSHALDLIKPVEP